MHIRRKQNVFFFETQMIIYTADVSQGLNILFFLADKLLIYLSLYIDTKKLFCGFERVLSL